MARSADSGASRSSRAIVTETRLFDGLPDRAQHAFPGTDGRPEASWRPIDPGEMEEPVGHRRVRSCTVLRGQGLTIVVGGRVLVDDASFSVYAGDKVGLVGRNGAGKTTLLRTVIGDHGPTSGRAQVTGGRTGIP